jgi:hypothetical protein
VLSDSPPETRKLFERALGITFVVRGFGRYGLIKLDVSKIEHLNTIWIEADCVQLFRRRAIHHRGKGRILKKH